MEANRKRTRRAVRFWRKAWRKCLAGQSRFPCYHPRRVTQWLYLKEKKRQQRLAKTIAENLVAEVINLAVKNIFEKLPVTPGQITPQTVKESVDQAIEKVAAIRANLPKVQNRKPEMQRVPSDLQSPAQSN